MIKTFADLKHVFSTTRSLTWAEIFACKAGIPICPECGSFKVVISGAWDSWAHAHCKGCKFTAMLEAFQDGTIKAGTLRHGQRLEMECPSCGVGSQMVARSSRRGWFLGCSNYPACHNTLEIVYEQ